MNNKLLFLILIIGLMTGCQTSSRYTQHKDSAPDTIRSIIDFKNAVPQYEPYKEQNSRPYKVLGKHYTPLLTGKGYEAIGNASWYGQKFHGHLTSNGETYDMYTMTAAHKTLPLPSFVKVTNLENNKQAIVRVNDRGPFHADRVIDLSYAAAMKLGFHRSGTTRVKLEVIYVDKDNMVSVGKQPPVSLLQYAGKTPEPELSEQPQPSSLVDPLLSYYIQVAALTDPNQAKAISEGLAALYQVPSEMPLIDNIYRLRLGPLTDRFQVQMLLDELKRNGYPEAYTIDVPL